MVKSWPLFDLSHPALEYQCYMLIWKTSDLFRSGLFLGLGWNGGYEFSAWILSYILAARYLTWYRRGRIALQLYGVQSILREDAPKSIHAQQLEVFPHLLPAIHPYFDISMGYACFSLGVAISPLLTQTLLRLHPFSPELLLEMASFYYRVSNTPDASWITDNFLMACFTRWIWTPARERLIMRRTRLYRRLMVRGTANPIYQYEALRSDTAIRLLKMQTWERSPVRTECSLVEVDLDSDLDYTAVSYCWGNEKTTDALRIHGGSPAYIYITQNASDALRSMMPLRGTKYIWIDSICINQKNEAERDHQITIMSRIFGQATEVVAHLAAPPNSVSLVSFLNRLCWHYLNEDRKALEIATAEESVDQDVFLHKPPMLDDKHGWIAWKEFVAHEYWSRMWIVQECAAARRITIIYGEEPLAWEMLETSNLVAASNFMLSHNLIVRSAQDGMNNINRIINRRLIYQDGPSDDIFTVAIDHSASRATKAEDKVNAVLNLSKDQLEPSLQPDYRRSPREVYMAVAELALKRNNFRLFGASGLCLHDSLGVQDLPSWVPDFSTDTVVVDTTRYYHRGYEAGGKETIEYRVDPLQDTLHVKGVIFDTILEVATTIDLKRERDRMRGIGLTSKDDSQLKIDDRIKEYLRLFESCVTSRRESEDPIRLREEFWRTVTDDFTGKGLSGEKLTNAIKDLEQWETALGEAADGTNNLHLSLNELLARVSSDTFAKDFWRSHVSLGSVEMLIEALTLGILGITEKGYTALVPPGTKAGDIVAVFQGSSVPQILRSYGPGSAEFHFWSEAYVAGIMHGEAMHLEKRWFELR